MLPRARNQHTAQQLTLVAIRQWERAITGVVSVPAAMALSVASGLMLVGSVIEHGFQLVEGTLAEVGRRVGEDLDEYGSPTETRDRVAGADVARPQ